MAERNHPNEELQLKMPPKFTGQRGEAVEWLQKCTLYLTMNKKTYNTNEKKIIFCLMLMNEGNAGKWAQMFIEDSEKQARDQQAEVTYGTWDNFKKEIKDAFDNVNVKARARILLRTLSQGKKSIDKYITEFKSIIAQCGISDFDIIADFFYGGLN